MITKICIFKRAALKGSLLFAATLLLPCFATSTAQAQKSVGSWSHIYEGIWYATGSNSSPLQRVYALRVDLENPHVTFRATPGNGGSAGETNRQTTPSFRSAYSQSVAINANYYQNTGSNGANIEGLLISNGSVVSNGNSYGNRPAQLRITSSNVASIVDSLATPSGIHTAIAGSVFPLLGGNALGENSEYNPRTGIGLSQNGRFLIMVVIDGRQPGYSNGATTRQLGQWLSSYGAWNGIMLDGGGSSTLVAQGAVKNRPSDGSPRAVGANFGVKSIPVRFDNHLDVYVRTGNTVHYKRRLIGSDWTNFNSLGGGFASDPAGVSFQEGTARVFVRDTSGNLRFRSYESGAWGTTWSTLGAPSPGWTGRPNAASREVGHIIVAVRGNDNTLWTRSLSNGSWSGWNRFNQTDGQVMSSPAVVSVNPNRVDIFYRGPDDGIRRMSFYQGSNWSGPTNLGGSLVDNPDVVSSQENKASIYSVAWDGNLWRKDMTIGSGYTSWTPIGTGGIQSAPAASNMGGTGNRQDVFFRGSNNNLHHIWQVNTTWNGPTNHGKPGANILGGPGAVTWNK